ncbi:hypothetical protein ABZW18_25880 [Streptomyces sp. NPDC004647]|uniref:hypothetical protein n=1 Tax=Streptomyces sp. NPDC004647 TaxID=3154671 RepID=UPI0033BE8F79
MDVDWWARGIAIGAASAAATNVVLTALTYRRVRPKVKVRLFRTGVRIGGREPEATEYQFTLRFSNSGTTPVKVERIELVTYPKWRRTKRFELVKGQRFDFRDDEPPEVPALNGMTHRFRLPTERLTDSEQRKHLRFRVLLSNGETIVSSKLKADEWLLLDE